MPIAAIGLGSNLPSWLGPPRATLLAAVERLGELGTVTAQSSLYRTAPVGYQNQPEFLNAAVLLETEHAPLSLLQALLAIERSFGRDRTQGPPKGPRTLDLDLLLYDLLLYDLLLYGSGRDGLVLHDPALTLPHPALHERRFALAPLAEIAPEWVHPVLHRSMADLLAALPPNAGAVTRIGCTNE